MDGYASPTKPRGAGLRSHDGGVRPQARCREALRSHRPRRHCPSAATSVPLSHHRRVLGRSAEGVSMAAGTMILTRPGQQRVAVAASCHQAVLDQRRSVQMMNQDEPAGQQQQDNCHANQARGLPFGCLFGHGAVRPMVMPIHPMLHWNPCSISHKGRMGKRDKIPSYAA